MAGEDAKVALLEYGEAIRGDWSQVDGRWVRTDLQYIASLIDAPPTPEATVRARLDLCPAGGGHWTIWCGRECSDA